MSLTTQSLLQNKMSHTAEQLNELLQMFDDMTSLNSRGLLGPLLDKSNILVPRNNATIRVTHDDVNQTCISVDLPGVHKSDVNLTYEDDILRWTAHRHDETTQPDGTKIRSVSDFSGMHRLPFVPTGVKGNLAYGVMNLVVTKPEAVSDRVVRVALE